MRKFHEAKLRGDEGVVVWGTGTPRREFLHVADLADAIVWLLERYDEEAIINVGCGEDLTIRELCEIVMAVTGYNGRLQFDATEPDGVPRKLLDVRRMHALGWRPKIALRSGIEQLYEWYKENIDSLRMSNP